MAHRNRSPSRTGLYGFFSMTYVCVDFRDVEVSPGHSQKVKAFTQDSTNKVILTVRAERGWPRQCAKMTAASGIEERNTYGRGVGFAEAECRACLLTAAARGKERNTCGGGGLQGQSLTESCTLLRVSFYFCSIGESVRMV